MNFEFNPFRLLIPPGGEPIRSITITSDIDWLTVPGPITGQEAIMPLSVKTDIPALKVFATSSAVGAPVMRSLSQGHIPNLEISQINGLQSAINSLVKSIASGNATALSVTNNGVGDYLITPQFGTVVNKIAQGNDSRFPSSVTGLRKGAGNGSLDIAAIAKTDYWDTTVFVASGASHAKGLVPDPGVTVGTTKFLCEDSTWKAPSTGGTVTSITVTVPTDLAVAPATITTSGTFAITRNTQTQNKFLASPIASTGAPVYRAIDFTDISALTGNTATKIAIGNDARFPATVTGIRKSTGAGSTDVAAVKFTDYWDSTVFGAKGPSSKIGLVPDPGPGAAPYTRYLRDDASWQPITLQAGQVDNPSLATAPAKTLKANATGATASPTDINAKDARSSLLLNLESVTLFGDADYTATAMDRYVVTSVNLTAIRTVTLPLANTFNAGQPITVVDESGAINGANILKVAKQGGDTIQGAGVAMSIEIPKGSIVFVSNGLNKWSVRGKIPAITRHFYVSNATYGTPSGVKALFIETLGGGGGGAGAIASASGASAGGGGGAGGYATGWIYSPAASYVMTVGIAGAGGAATGLQGSAGGNTSFGGIISSDGGAGGQPMATGTSSAFSLPGSGGLSTGGELNLSGSYGGHGQRLSGSVALSGWGAAPEAYGISIAGLTVSSSNGNSPGSGFGSGGSGALSYTATGFTGGNGTQGMIVVTEYY